MNEGNQRRLAAIVSADVVGYSRLMGEDEAGTLAALRQFRQELFEPLVVERRGQVIKRMGDGWLLEFASAVDAVTCALQLQGKLASHAILKLRIGLHVGDITHEDEDIYGDGVNIAARLQEIADPGGIVISDVARRSIDGKLAAGIADLGRLELKNIAEPLNAYGWGMTRARSEPASLPLPDKPSIVVLPFDNMSGDPDQEYFSDGISEDIITDLSKASGLFVIARNSAFVYKGNTYNVPDVCRELGVRFALEGSIRKAGNRVRINAQLIEAGRGSHLWAERYDRELTDIFAVQDDVTQQIVGALRVTLSEAEKSLFVEGGTKNVEAHDLFLRGRGVLFGLKRDRDMFNSATACFQRAIKLDPDYAGPYAGLGMAYMLDYQNHWSAAPETSLDRAERFVGEAIAREDKDPFSHYVAALVAMWKKDHEQWAREADRALSLNPNYALAINARGNVYLFSGEPAKAIPFIERAMRLDPAVQQQFIHFLGTAHFVAGNYETAATLFKDRISVNPSTDLSRAFLAAALGHLGEADEAHRIWRELMEINSDYSFADHIGRLPFRDPADAEKFGVGLRKVGLLE